MIIFPIFRGTKACVPSLLSQILCNKEKTPSYVLFVTQKLEYFFHIACCSYANYVELFSEKKGRGKDVKWARMNEFYAIRSSYFCVEKDIA